MRPIVKDTNPDGDTNVCEKNMNGHACLMDRSMVEVSKHARLFSWLPSLNHYWEPLRFLILLIRLFWEKSLFIL